MKKIIRSNIKVLVAVVITAILFGGIGVYAVSQYLAKDIAFTPTNDNFKVTNVEDALNELYSKSNMYVYESGEFNQYVKHDRNYVYVNIDLSRTYTEEDNAKLIITYITQPNAIYYYSGAITDKIIGNSVTMILLNFAAEAQYSKTYNVKYSVVRFDN